METSLLERTKLLLLKDKGSWPTTAAETGLDREWMSKLAQGKIDDPGVNKIERLFNYLSQKYPAEAAPTPDTTQVA